MGRAIRTWGWERYMPIRQQIDEDWQERALGRPLLKEVLVDLGLNAAFFPREAGGMDTPEVMTIANVMCEELARIASGFAGIMKNVYEIIKGWTADRVVAGKPLKEHSIVADMLSDVAMHIELTSAWMWAYTRELDHPETYGWEP